MCVHSDGAKDYIFDLVIFLHLNIQHWHQDTGECWHVWHWICMIYYKQLFFFIITVDLFLIPLCYHHAASVLL